MAPASAYVKLGKFAVCLGALGMALFFVCFFAVHFSFFVVSFCSYSCFLGENIRNHKIAKYYIGNVGTLDLWPVALVLCVTHQAIGGIPFLHGSVHS